MKKSVISFCKWQPFDTMLISFLCHSTSSVLLQPLQPSAITSRNKERNPIKYIVNSEVRGQGNEVVVGGGDG